MAYLKATPEVLCRHLLMGKVERPLVKGKSPEELIDYVTRHLAEREAFYRKARYTLDVSLLDNGDKIRLSVERLRSLLHI